MPYAVSFSKRVELVDPDQYFNDCCIGGDAVLDRLLPSLRAKYGEVQANQEDWGWFAWFDQGHVKLAVDIVTENHSAYEFQIHLTSRRARFILGDKVEDGAELEDLRNTVTAELLAWSVANLEIRHVNEKYLPV